MPFPLLPLPLLPLPLLPLPLLPLPLLPPPLLPDPELGLGLDPDPEGLTAPDPDDTGGGAITELPAPPDGTAPPPPDTADDEEDDCRRNGGTKPEGKEVGKPAALPEVLLPPLPLPPMGKPVRPRTRTQMLVSAVSRSVRGRKFTVSTFFLSFRGWWYSIMHNFPTSQFYLPVFTPKTTRTKNKTLQIKIDLLVRSVAEHAALRHACALVLIVGPFWQIHVSDAWLKSVAQPRAEAYCTMQPVAHDGICALSAASCAGSMVPTPPDDDDDDGCDAAAEDVVACTGACGCDCWAAARPARPSVAARRVSCVFIALFCFFWWGFLFSFSLLTWGVEGVRVWMRMEVNKYAGGEDI